MNTLSLSTRPSRLTRRARALAPALALALALPACSGDDGSTTASSDTASGSSGDTSSSSSNTDASSSSGATTSQGPTTGGSQTGSSGSTSATASSSATTSSATEGTVGSTSHGTGTSATTSGTTGALTCQLATDELGFFINKNSPCMDDSDCVTVEASCWQEQQDCCVIYLNKTYDAPTWLDIYEQYQTTCGVDQCGCCAKVPFEPACVDGFCGPDQG